MIDKGTHPAAVSVKGWITVNHHRPRPDTGQFPVLQPAMTLDNYGQLSFRHSYASRDCNCSAERTPPLSIKLNHPSTNRSQHCRLRRPPVNYLKPTGCLSSTDNQRVGLLDPDRNTDSDSDGATRQTDWRLPGSRKAPIRTAKATAPPTGCHCIGMFSDLGRTVRRVVASAVTSSTYDKRLTA